MPVRIYTLAKEFKIDSKELVEICTKAGISGKGSALASLSEEEVVKLKDFLSKPKASESKRPAAPPPSKSAPVPMLPPSPTTLNRGAPVPYLPAAPSVANKLVAPVEPPPTVVVAEVPAAPAIPEVPLVVAEVAPPVAPAVEPPATTPAQAATVAPPDAGPPGMRREDYMAPGGGMSGRPQSLGRSSGEKPTEPRKRPPVERSSARSGPAIKLAAMPTVQQPVNKAKSNEPAPQKPDLKLPLDAIRAGKSGAKPLSEHIKQHEKRKEAAKGRPLRPGEVTPAPVAPGTGRERPRRGKGNAPATPGEGELAASLGGRDARTLARKRTGPAKKRGDDDENSYIRRKSLRRNPHSTSTAAPRKGKVQLTMPCTVRSFSEAIGVPAQKIQAKLLGMGTMVTITAELSEEMAELLALEFGAEVEIRQPVDVADELMARIEATEDNPDNMVTRAPVITVLGHVDHGKTSLLDKIIGINVAKGESGGITQHIRAYQIERNGKKISFVDTPGHEAFTEMRARGANVTDIAVLVVAADDGVMPQTEEAISHARAAGVPIVVALNKIDLPGVDTQRIFQQLAVNELLPTEWGGDIEVVKTSATTGVGLDDLVETLFTIAELQDFRADPDRAAIGTCLEAEIQPGRGVMAKIIVQKGTLRVGDAIVCGAASGHIKAMYNTLRTSELVEEAGPSMPVNITGLDMAPAAGDHFYVLDDIAEARQVAVKRQHQSRQQSLVGATTHITLENLFEHLGAEETQSLNMILRADVRGSIEAIRKELTKLEHPEVKIKILQASVGGVSEADVHLADASDAVIIAFNVVPDEKARALADQKGVQVRRYDIIYKVTEDLRAAMEGMLRPEKREMELGRALVQRTFTISRLGTIAGCRVLSGNIQRNCRMRVIRDNRIVGDYGLDSLRREKDDARDVREGLECGIKLSGFNDLKEGDILEAYKIEEIARTF